MSGKTAATEWPSSALLSEFVHAHFCSPSLFTTAHVWTQVKARQLWGDTTYTHDSDIVAVLLHRGYYRIVPEQPSSVVTELRVHIKLLPAQWQYPSKTRHGLRSRSWRLNPEEGGKYCSYKVHTLKQCETTHVFEVLIFLVRIRMLLRTMPLVFGEWRATVQNIPHQWQDIWVHPFRDLECHLNEFYCLIVWETLMGTIWQQPIQPATILSICSSTVLELLFRQCISGTSQGLGCSISTSTEMPLFLLSIILS